MTEDGDKWGGRQWRTLEDGISSLCWSSSRCCGSPGRRTRRPLAAPRSRPAPALGPEGRGAATSLGSVPAWRRGPGCRRRPHGSRPDSGIRASKPQQQPVPGRRAGAGPGTKFGAGGGPKEPQDRQGAEQDGAGSWSARGWVVLRGFR